VNGQDAHPLYSYLRKTLPPQTIECGCFWGPLPWGVAFVGRGSARASDQGVRVCCAVLVAG